MAEPEMTSRPTNDAYTGMLAIALLALIAGSTLMFLDYNQYPTRKPDPLPKAPPPQEKVAPPAPKVEPSPDDKDKKDEKDMKKDDDAKKDDTKKDDAKKDDKDMKKVQISSICQVGDQTLFRRNNRWVDAKIVDKETDQPERTVEFASDEYNKIVDDLAAQGRQGLIAQGGDCLLLYKGQRVLVKGPGEATE